MIISGAFCSGLAIGGILVWQLWKVNPVSITEEEEGEDDTQWTEEMVDDWVGYHYMSGRRYVPFECVSEEALNFPVKVAHLCNRMKSVSQYL